MRQWGIQGCTPLIPLEEAHFLIIEKFRGTENTCFRVRVGSDCLDGGSTEHGRSHQKKKSKSDFS